MFGFGNRKEIEALRREMAELKDQQGPSHDDVEALRAELREVRENPVIAVVGELERRLPAVGKLPRWIVALVLTGAIGSMATFCVIYWQASLLNAQVTQQEHLMNQQAIQFREQMVSQTVQFREQMESQNELLKRQDSQIARQDALLKQQQDETRTARDHTLQALRLQEESNQLMRSQNDAILRQAEQAAKQATQLEARNELTERQISTQKEVQRDVLRSELLAIVLDRSDCDRSGLADNQLCLPKAGRQTREHALHTLMQLGGELLDLAGADLSGFNLSNSNLRYSNLSGADLSGSVLNQTDLSGARLTGAVLDRSQLVDSKLVNANLTRARMKRANLTHADLSYAIIDATDLTEANLSNSLLPGDWLLRASFTGADLRGTKIHIPPFGIEDGWTRLQLIRTLRTPSGMRGVPLQVYREALHQLRRSDHPLPVGPLERAYRQLLSTCGDSNTQKLSSLPRPSHWRNNIWPRDSGTESGCPGNAQSGDGRANNR